MAITTDPLETVSTDTVIFSILRRLHTRMVGPERECRWSYSDQKQIYHCQHVSIQARDVSEQYWKQFGA